jgi:mono/diheme cytochrome c family protein
VEFIMKSEGQSVSRSARFGIGVLMLASAAVVLVGNVRAATSAGWYTPQQAQAGQQSFNNYCAECHRPDLTGAEGPALLGDAFLKKWGNKPLSDLFNFEHANMPATNPGSLPDDTMWSITAYILQKNGFAAGSTSLGQQLATRTLAK